MSFELSFSEDFFYGEGYSLDDPPETSEQPTSVLQALVSLSTAEQTELREEFKIPPEASLEALVAHLLDLIRETNTCTDLSSPVEVWIDPEGWNTIRVY